MVAAEWNAISPCSMTSKFHLSPVQSQTGGKPGTLSTAASGTSWRQAGGILIDKNGKRLSRNEGICHHARLSRANPGGIPYRLHGWAKIYDATARSIHKIGCVVIVSPSRNDERTEERVQVWKNLFRCEYGSFERVLGKIFGVDLKAFRIRSSWEQGRCDMKNDTQYNAVTRISPEGED